MLDLTVLHTPFAKSFAEAKLESTSVKYFLQRGVGKVIRYYKKKKWR